MIQLNLDAEEQAILTDILDGYLSDLRMEISNTDSLDFRLMLRTRKEVIKKVLAGLRQ